MKDQAEELKTAQNPQTSEAVLEYLAMYSGPDVRRAVAQHPNASLGALLSLAAEFLEDVLHNPSFEARFLDSFGQLSLSTHAPLIALMLRHPAVSPALRRSLFAAVEQRNAKVLRAQMPESLLSDGQFNAEDRGLWSIILAHPEFPAERLDEFLYGAVPEHRWAASQHPKAPRSLIRTLLSLGSSADLKRYAPENVKPVSVDILETFSRLGFWAQYLVSLHPALPEEILLRLIKSPFAPVRGVLAAHPALPPQALHILSRDTNSTVLAKVASHPMTSTEDLIRLYEKNPFSLKMKQHIAANAKTPDEILIKLATKPEPQIWMALAARSNTPENILMRLLELTKKREYERLNALAQSPSLTSKLGETLAKSKQTRPFLASNPYAPEDVLLTVSKDTSFEVRSALVQNWSTPPRVLHLFLRDRSEEVREFARVHPNQQPIQTITEKVLRLARELLTRFEEQSVTLVPMVQRALLTFEAIAPQGFVGSSQTVFVPLGEALSAIDHPLAQYLLLLTQALSKPTETLPLWRLRSYAISCFALLGVDASEAGKIIEQRICE
jgi:hypothetical protein